MHISCASLHLVGTLTFVLAQGECLPTTGKTRRNITVGLRSLPLGIFKLDFGASPMLMAEMFKILVEEMLDYNVIYSGSGPSSPIAVYALSGCAAPSDYLRDAKCSKDAHDMFVHHISFEIWYSSALNHIQHIQSNYEKASPLDLGSIGYEGIETLYIPGAPLKRAYDENGTTLEYYRAWKKASGVNKHFARHRDIPASQLLPCTETRLLDSLIMAKYLEFTGDIGGLNYTSIDVKRGSSESTLSGRCWDSSWWLSPACRETSDNCIPLVTGGNGWEMDAFMQKAAEYDLPLAIGVAATYNEYLALPYAFNILFYWWQPDTAFTSTHSVEIIFPRHDSIAWAQGDKRTTAYRTPLQKLAYFNFAVEVPDAHYLAQALTITPQEVDNLLLHMQLASLNVEAMACQWVQNNSATWERWLPNALRCPAGYGLVDGMGIFTSNVSNASGCAACTPGSKSARLNKDGLKTNLCEECGAGHFSNAYQSSACVECSKGYFAATAKMQECDRCQIRTYAAAEGSIACSICSDPHQTTSYEAATKEDDCMCDEGFYLRPGFGCAKCDEGLLCDRSNDAPRQVVGYHVQVIDRELREYSIWRCPNWKACPAGELGECSGGAFGKMCLQCAQGEYLDAVDGCLKCKSGHSLTLVAVALLLLMTIPTIIFVSNKLYGDTSKSQHVFTSLGQIVVFIQVLALIQTLQIKWIYPFEVMIEAAAALSFHIEILRISCVGNPGPVQEFCLKMLCPLIFVILMATCHYFAKIVLELHIHSKLLKNNIGQFTSMAYIPLSMLAFTPFSCSGHPNNERTVVSYPSVSCDYSNAKHIVMVIVGFFSISLYLIGYLAVVYTATWLHPRMVAKGKTSFLVTWGFLFSKWRFEYFWFGAVMMSRNFLFSMLPMVIPPENINIILILLQVVLLAVFTLTVRLLPWRGLDLNAIDIILSALLLYIIHLCGLAMPAVVIDAVQGTICCVVFLFIALFVLGGLGKLAIVRIASQQIKSREQEALAAIQQAVRHGETTHAGAVSLVKCKWSPEAIHECIKAEEKRQSENGGISVDYLLSREFLVLARQRSHKDDPDFHDLKDPFFLGDDALGKNMICPRDGKPGCALIDFLPRSYRGQCTDFLSWSWGYTVTLVRDALDSWMFENLSGIHIKGKRESLTASQSQSLHEKASERYLYCCFFVNNQYRILKDAGGAASTCIDLKTVFEFRLVQIGRVVAILDAWHKPIYLTRIWAIYEQFTAAKLEIPVTIILPHAEHRSMFAEITKGREGICRLVQSFRQIDSEHATAFHPEDEANVKSLIRESIGFESVNEAVNRRMTGWLGASIASQFDEIVHASKVQLARGPSLLDDVLDSPSHKTLSHSLGSPWPSSKSGHAFPEEAVVRRPRKKARKRALRTADADQSHTSDGDVFVDLLVN